jgi:hypothetical protein
MLHVRRPGTARLYPARSRAGCGLMGWRTGDRPPVTSDKVTTRRLKARAPHAGSGLFHIEISCVFHQVLRGFTRFKEIGPERAIYCLV